MSVVIIIGLPGSGKTELLKKYQTDNYEIDDDFIFNFFDGYLIKNIQAGNRIVLTDPRLCLPNIFKHYISIIEEHISRSNIKLIVFENNPEQCIRNIKNRNDGRRNIEMTIQKYSEQYNLELYQEYDHEIIPVYA